MQMNIDHSKRKIFLFLVFLLGWGAALTGILSIYYQMQVGGQERALVEKVEHSLLLQRKMARTHFSMIISDLKFLAKDEVLQDYLADPSADNLSKINNEYLLFAENKRNYEQIRYLNDTGMEVVRINRNGDVAVCVAAEKLQSKGNRYYFRDAYTLARDKVFVSPFDLNVEHG